MRLLNTERVELEFFIDEIPPYAILSHTWDQEEVIFQDMEQSRAKDKKGYAKNCCSIARDNGYNYVWIDTCCIDKTSSAELTEAINSMYRYYREAEVCYSFLSDISSPSDFSQSRWFTRGWTLQELIAPARMIFFDKEWKQLGTRESLGYKTSERTGIPQAILSGTKNLESASIAQRMSWAAGRKTTRLEDRAYSLMGIFDINMPLLYGEGHKAFIRLQEEILKVSDDHSIFAWRYSKTRSVGGLLAETPDAFKSSENIISWNPFTLYNSPFTVTNKGVHLDAPFIAQAQGGLGLVILHCTETESKDQLVGIYLRDPFLTMEHFERCRPEEFTLINLGQFSPSQYPTRNLCIRLRGKVSSRTSGSSVFKHQELQPRHSTEGGQNYTTNGAEDAEADEPEKDPRQKLLLAASEEQLLARKDTQGNLVDGRGRSVLSYAAEDGHCDVVRLILGSGKLHPDLRDKAGRSALWYASKNDHEGLVKLLLETGWVDPNIRDLDGHTMLWRACKRGQDVIAELFLKAGADADAEVLKEGSSFRGRYDSDTESLYSDTGSLPFPSFLVSSKKATGQQWPPSASEMMPSNESPSQYEPSSPDFEYDPELVFSNESLDEVEPPFLAFQPYFPPDLYADDGDYEPALRPALWQAASRGHHVIVQMLLGEHPMPLNSPGCFTSLCEAVKLGYVEVIKVLLEKCPRGRHWEMLFVAVISWATASMQPASLDVLIKCSEDVDAVEPRVRAVYSALGVLSGNEAVVRILLEKGAPTDDDTLNANLIFEIAKWCRCLEITTLLRGTSSNDPMYRARFGMVLWSPDPSTTEFKCRARSTEDWDITLLWCAVARGDKAIVESLLEYGANTEAKIKEGMTVLFYAVSLGYSSIVRCLLKHGANKEERDEYGWSLLICAVSILAYDTDRDMIELLLDEGADVEEKDKEGNTPLMHGAWLLDTAEPLLARGADVNARNKHGVTPLMKAVLYKDNTDVVRLFLEHGADPMAKDETDRTAASQAKDTAVLSLLREYSERS
ncbi:hypothetical protein CDV36_003647 [Fusarium kuroshium]|uniref:Heterokaryon incompatibility domain-containing protein n=1 Tax=Fusarium kuroshium TaxID=2010991 RepID=A0A3M2SGK3_9HYPO|nr:hypothetical protein CDV36_003647 [Fusarium kuroshium]